MAPGESSGLRSPKAQAALVLLGAVALGVLYWQFVYSPLADDQAKFQANFKKLEKENKTLGEEERIQNDMIRCKPELDSLNRENELMLPAEAEPVAFLRNLSIMAATAGLEQGTTKMLGESEVQAPPASADEKRRAEERKKGGERSPLGSTLSGKGTDAVPCWEKVPGLQADPAAKVSFVRVPFVIEVRGTFHQLMRYFWMVHQHANAGRIITIEDLSLTKPAATSDGIVMTAKFTAVGFREPDAPAGAEPAAPAATKGMRAQVKEATQKREAQVDAAAGSAGGEVGAGPGAGKASPSKSAPEAAASSEPADKSKRGLDRLTKPEAVP